MLGLRMWPVVHHCCCVGHECPGQEAGTDTRGDSKAPRPVIFHNPQIFLSVKCGQYLLHNALERAVGNNYSKFQGIASGLW